MALAPWAPCAVLAATASDEEEPLQAWRLDRRQGSDLPLEAWQVDLFTGSSASSASSGSDDDSESSHASATGLRLTLTSNLDPHTLESLCTPECFQDRAAWDSFRKNGVDRNRIKQTLKSKRCSCVKKCLARFSAQEVQVACNAFWMLQNPAAGCSAVSHADFGQWWPWKQLQL